MMFYALAVCVCLAVLFLAMATASLLGWSFRGLVSSILRSWSPATAARVLFAVRLLPLCSALVLALGLALPAFLRFEPRVTRETMGAKLLLLALAGAVVFTVMAVRGLRILRATGRTERRWRAGCQEHWVDLGGYRLPLYLVDGVPGLLAVTGFFRPRLFVAKEVARMLSWAELSAALGHEIAHVNFYDNLKQLLMKMTKPPRWLGGDVDKAWSNVSEVAADEAALAGGASALDLAAALVKTSTLRRGDMAGEELAASHLLPETIGSAMEMRVARLQKALQSDLASPKIESKTKHWQMMAIIVLPLVVYVAAVTTLLPVVHDALEFLVR